MGRAPCCDKANVKKGPWSPEEDAKLKAYIDLHGTGGNWIALPQKIGLKRCGKSCRLRWLNYLRPNIKHGGFSEEEDNIICSLYVSIGSRWSIIAAQLPGRTDNDIKNYWNTRLKKKLLGKQRKEQQQARRKQQSDEIIKREQSHHKLAAANSASLITQTNPHPYWPHSMAMPLVTNASIQDYDDLSNQTSLMMRTFLNELPYTNTISTSSHDTRGNMSLPQYPTTMNMISINGAASQPSNNNNILQGFDDDLLGSIMQGSFYGMESVDMASGSGGGSTNTASTESNNNSTNWGDMTSLVNLVSSDYDEGCRQQQGIPLQDDDDAAAAAAAGFDENRYFGMMQMQ